MAWSCWGSSGVTLIQFLTALRTFSESTTVPKEVVVLKLSTNWDLEGFCNEKIVSLHLCFTINQDTHVPPKTLDLIPFLSWHNTAVGKITHVFYSESCLTQNMLCNFYFIENKSHVSKYLHLQCTFQRTTQISYKTSEYFCSVNLSKINRKTWSLYKFYSLIQSSLRRTTNMNWYLLRSRQRNKTAECLVWHLYLCHWELLIYFVYANYKNGKQL